jgi:hypothetical protein
MFTVVLKYLDFKHIVTVQCILVWRFLKLTCFPVLTSYKVVRGYEVAELMRLYFTVIHVLP